MAQFDCELVFRENGSDRREPHAFDSDVLPGTMLHLEGLDWMVVELRERPTGLLPQVVCRPAFERV
jgi:hypothetical protein